MITNLALASVGLLFVGYVLVVVLDKTAVRSPFAPVLIITALVVIVFGVAGLLVACIASLIGVVR